MGGADMELEWQPGSEPSRETLAALVPLTEEERWILKYWGPWLDPNEPPARL